MSQFERFDFESVFVSEVVLACECVCVSAFVRVRAFVCLRLRQCACGCVRVCSSKTFTHTNTHTHTDTQTAHQSQIARTPAVLNSSGVASNKNKSLIDPLQTNDKSFD